MKAAAIAAQIGAGARRRDLEAARLRYAKACDTAPLGQCLRVEERPDGTGFRLVATADIGANVAVTAFAADAAVMRQPPRAPPHDPPGFCTVQHRGRAYLAAGPLTATPVELASSLGFAAAPVLGFPPATMVVSRFEAEAPPPPDRAALWVGDAADGSPYEGVPRTDAAVPTLAHLTVAYLGKTIARANVRVAAAPGRPTVLLTTREVREGEELLTSRTPCHWLGPECTEKVLAHLVSPEGRGVTARGGAPPLEGPALRGLLFGA